METKVAGYKDYAQCETSSISDLKIRDARCGLNLGGCSSPLAARRCSVTTDDQSQHLLRDLLVPANVLHCGPDCMTCSRLCI